MVNFLQHKRSIIENYCNAFKKPAFKEIWGVDLNCNTKLPELAWLDKELLNYQYLSEDMCSSGCTIQNPAFLISQYTDCTGPIVFPFLNAFNPFKVCPSLFPQTYGPGQCCTKVTINNGSNVTTYNLTVGNASQQNNPEDGLSTFTFTPLIGKTIQFALGGYGFYAPGVQYSFDPSTGTITLLEGLKFNLGETYTIFSY